MGGPQRRLRIDRETLGIAAGGVYRRDAHAIEGARNKVQEERERDP